MSIRQRIFFFALLCCGIWLRLRHFWDVPTLVAEEGTVFFAGFLNHQWIWVSAGYLNTLTTTVIQLGAHLWPEELPRFCLTVAILLQAASVLWFTRRAWNALLPLPWRLACCVLWCWAQPIPEGTGILLYSFWFLGLGTFFIFFELLFLKTESTFHTRFPLLMTSLWILLSTLSGPVASQLVLILLFIHGGRSLWGNRLTEAFARFFSPLLDSTQRRQFTAAWLLGTSLQAMTLLTHSSGLPQDDSALHWIPLALLNQFTMRVSLPWVLPHSWMILLNNSIPLWICHLLALALFGGLFRSRSPAWHKLWGMLLLLINASSLLGRPHIVQLLAISGGNKTISFAAGRYSLMTALLWLPLLISGLTDAQQSLLKKIRSLTIGLLIALTALSNIPLWGEPTNAPAPYPWREAWEQLRQHQPDGHMLIPLVPEGTLLSQ